MDSNSTPVGGGKNPKDEEEEDESLFMEKLKSAPWKRYCFQKDMIRTRRHWPFSDPRIIYELEPSDYDAFENQSFPIIRARDLDGGVKHYSFDELMQITECLKSTTFVCYTVFGTLHRGTIESESGRRDVLVKTWEYFLPRFWKSCHLITRIHDELNLLRVPEIKSHPNVVNLIGFHCERRLAVIYTGAGSFQLLHEIIPTDTFSWKDRMKVANEMASVLEAFHGKGLVHAGVNSVTILVAEDKSPMVWDFGLFSYIEYRRVYEELVRELYSLHVKYLEGPPWSMKCDIFAYGILLLELINKRVYKELLLPMPIGPSEEEILNYDLKKSVVDDSFYIDEYVALRYTKLAIDCLKVNLDEQPTIGDIVRELKDLEDLMLHSPPKKLQKISY